MFRPVSWLEKMGEMGGVGLNFNDHFCSQESSAIMNYTEHIWIKHQTSFGL